MNISGWYKWSILGRSQHNLRIRRYRKVNGKIKWQTLPKTKYQNLNIDEIEALVRRLNTTHVQKEQLAKSKYDFTHAFINQTVLANFLIKLETEASDRNHINSSINTLNEYTLNFFINNLKLPDPNDWKKFEAKFGKYLMGSDIGTRRIKSVIQVTNRFIKFLHNQYPDEVRLFQLEPVSKNVLKQLSLESSNIERTKYITEKDYKIICKEITPVLLPSVKIAYQYGLRCAEVLGLSVDDVYEDMLNVERQLKKLKPIAYYSHLKNKEKRQVPYWFSTPDEIYHQILEVTPMHPDTLSRNFKLEMIRLNLPYQFHDLRRTFITNALRMHHYRDVQLAAGHADLKTTQRYAQDDRQLQRKRYKPLIKAVK